MLVLLIYYLFIQLLYLFVLLLNFGVDWIFVITGFFWIHQTLEIIRIIDLKT